MFYSSIPVLSALVSAAKAASNGDNTQLASALKLFEIEQQEQSKLSLISDKLGCNIAGTNHDLTMGDNSLILPNGNGFDVMCWYHISANALKPPAQVPPNVACPSCDADLTLPHAITRCYSEKNGKPNMTRHGHLSKKRELVWDTSVDLSGGNYDLYDDSDRCNTCQHQL